MHSLDHFVHFVNKKCIRLLHSSKLSNSSRIDVNKQSSNRLWSNLTMKNKKDGRLIKVRVQDLPKDRFNDFIDFNLKFFVRDEITFKVSGVHENPEAVKECRNYLSTIMSKPTTHNHIYLLDDGTSTDIIGASSMTLVKGNEFLDEVEVKTEEMKRFLDILHRWNNLFTTQEVMKKYGINTFYQDVGVTIHPKYRLFGIAQYETLVRRMICKANGVPVTGSWCTALASQRACKADNWDTLFEISYEKLATILGINFKDAPPICKFMAMRVE